MKWIEAGLNFFLIRGDTVLLIVTVDYGEQKMMFRALDERHEDTFTLPIMKEFVKSRAKEWYVTLLDKLRVEARLLNCFHD